MVRLAVIPPVVELLAQVGSNAFLQDAAYDLGQMYRRELVSIRSVHAFEAFVHRWAGFYALGYQENRNPMERALLNRFNTKLVFKKWLRCDAGLKREYNGNGWYYALAATVALPTVLLTGWQIARQCQVPFNVALVQLYGDDLL